VAVFLLFSGLYFLVDLVRAGTAGTGTWMAALRARLLQLWVIVSMAGIAALWLSGFIDFAQNKVPPSFVTSSSVTRIGWLASVVRGLILADILPFTAASYRLGLILLIVVATIVLCSSDWRSGVRKGSAAPALIAMCIICFILFCSLPFGIKGCWYFPNRVLIFWALFLFSTTAALRPAPKWSNAAGILTLCVTGVVLFLQWTIIAKIDLALSPVLEAAAAKAGSEGLIIGASTSAAEGLVFDPYRWSGAHYFRRSQAFLKNAPWMEQPHIMIKTKKDDRWSYLDPAPAGTVLLGILRKGESPPELAFLVRDDPPGPTTEEIAGRLNWRPLTPAGGAVAIVARSR
jgi:hypothetical protein